MDFENLQADVNMILTRHFNSGREGRKINKIILHHNAANLTVEGCYSVWQNREASAHYQVESSGRIGQLVNDWDTAWHAGNWDANLTSIGVEHADCSSNPWRISDECLEAGAHLVAALCKYYGLGRPAWGVNVFGHSDFSSTACPASLAKGGSQHDQYMSRAGEWYDAMCNSTTPTQPQPSASTTVSSGNPNVTYCAKVNGHWLPNVINFNNVNDDGFAGIPCQGMSAIAVKVDGCEVRYQAHVLGGDWLPIVTGFDITDFNNGYAGDGSSLIDGVIIKVPGKNVYYRSQTVARAGWLDVVCNDSDYAGLYGEAMDRLQICVSDRNPF